MSTLLIHALVLLNPCGEIIARWEEERRPPDYSLFPVVNATWNMASWSFGRFPIPAAGLNSPRPIAQAVHISFCSTHSLLPLNTANCVPTTALAECHAHCREAIDEVRQTIEYRTRGFVPVRGFGDFEGALTADSFPVHWCRQPSGFWSESRHGQLFMPWCDAEEFDLDALRRKNSLARTIVRIKEGAWQSEETRFIIDPWLWFFDPNSLTCDLRAELRAPRFTSALVLFRDLSEIEQHAVDRRLSIKNMWGPVIEY